MDLTISVLGTSLGLCATVFQTGSSPSLWSGDSGSLSLPSGIPVDLSSSLLCLARECSPRVVLPLLVLHCVVCFHCFLSQIFHCNTVLIECECITCLIWFK